MGSHYFDITRTPLHNEIFALWRGDFTTKTKDEILHYHGGPHNETWYFRFVKEKKEELCPMTKAPTPTEMSKGQSDNTNNATKKFD